MSNIGSSEDKGRSGPLSGKDDASPTSEQSATTAADKKLARSRYTEMQSAPRFPIKLPVAVKSGGGESRTETANISANGVLFQVVDADMPVGSTVDFTISLPADIVGADADVRLDCKGRVVRNFEEAGRHGVGVVIDEYRFDRH